MKDPVENLSELLDLSMTRTVCGVTGPHTKEAIFQAVMSLQERHFATLLLVHLSESARLVQVCVLVISQ